MAARIKESLSMEMERQRLRKWEKAYRSKYKEAAIVSKFGEQKRRRIQILRSAEKAGVDSFEMVLSERRARAAAKPKQRMASAA